MHDFSFYICPGCGENLGFFPWEGGWILVEHRKPTPIYTPPNYSSYWCVDP